MSYVTALVASETTLLALVILIVVTAYRAKNWRSRVIYRALLNGESHPVTVTTQQARAHANKLALWSVLSGMILLPASFALGAVLTSSIANINTSILWPGLGAVAVAFALTGAFAAVRAGITHVINSTEGK